MQFNDTYFFKFPKSALPNYKGIFVCTNVFTIDGSKPSQARVCAHFVGILCRFYWPHAVQFQDTYFFKVPKFALPNYKSISVCANGFTSDESKPNRGEPIRAKQELTLGLWVPISFKRFLLFGFVFSSPLLTQLALIDHWCKTLQRDVCRQV